MQFVQRVGFESRVPRLHAPVANGHIIARLRSNGAMSETINLRVPEPPETSHSPVVGAIINIADPGPLGLAAFAMTTFVLSVVNAGIVDKSVEPVVLGLALFYGGLAQLIAGMWEFRKGNTFGALAFSWFGAFWLSFFYYVSFIAKGIGDQVGTATGLYLLAWTIFTAYMTIASIGTFWCRIRRLRRVDLDVPVPHPRRLRRQHRLHRRRWLPRHHHRAASVVCIVRRSDQRDLQSHRDANLAPSLIARVAHQLFVNQRRFI